MHPKQGREIRGSQRLTWKGPAQLQVQAAARKSALFVSKETGSGGPAGYFFFTEQSPIFALFPSLVCKQPHCPMPHPHSCGSALPMSAEGCSPFQESNTTAHPSPLPQIPSLPRAQRKHAKHFTQRFMAVLLLLFLNRGGKGLEVFINKGFRKTRLIIQSAAWSGNCASLTQIHGTPLPACCFHTT